MPPSPTVFFPCGGRLPDLHQIAPSMLKQRHGHFPAPSRSLGHEQGVVFAPHGFLLKQTTVRVGTSIPIWNDDRPGDL